MTTIGRWKAIYETGSVAWAAALFPAAIAQRDQLGSAGRLISSFLYAAGAVICHQRSERSFQLSNVNLPVCARCTGIYVAAALTSLLVATLSLVSPRVGSEFRVDRRWTWRLVLIALLPTMLTVGWEWTTGDVPSNALRFAAGLPIGAFVSWIVLRTPEADAQSE